MGELDIREFPNGPWSDHCSRLGPGWNAVYHLAGIKRLLRLMVNTSKTPERGTARLWRGLVGWPPVLVLLTGIVVFLGGLESGGIIVLVMVMAALIIMPIGLAGLAITSESTGEKVVSGIVAGVIVLFDVAFTFLVIVISQVG
jgi:hypothetical protein